MAQRFIACDREQSFLMPPDVREWLPEDHFAWFVLEAVESMELEAFYGAYRADGRSRPAFDPAMMGWIQLVVATPDVEELRCRGEALRWFVPWLPGGVARDVRRRGAGNTGSGSGRRSLEVRQVRTLRWRRGSCRTLVSGGFGRVAGCRLSLSRRCPGAICRSASGRRSRCWSLVAAGCGRSPVSWVGRRRRFP